MLALLLSLTACSSPEAQCEDAVDAINDCVGATGSTAAINESTVCDDVDAGDLEDIACLQEAADEATCSTAEGLESLLLAICSCDPSACTSDDGDDDSSYSGYGGDTGYSYSY